VVLVSLSQALAGAAVPTIAGSLGRWDLAAWPIGAFLLTSTMAAPLLGQAGDVYGRRRVLRLLFLGSLVTAILSGLAPTMPWLIACRSLQGVVGGGLTAVAGAAVADLIPRSLYSRFQGLSTTLTSATTVLAPFVGGVILDVASWRWVFFATAPPALVLLLLSHRLPPGDRRSRGIDVGGAVTLAVGTGALLAGLQTTAGHAQALAAPAAIGLLAAGGTAVPAFITWERRRADPIIPLGLFTDRLFARSAALSLLSGAVLFASALQLQQYLQAGLGLSPQAAGIRLVPLFAALSVASVAYGRLTRREQVGRRLVRGCLILAVGLALLSLEAHQVLPALLPAIVALGVGLGIVLPAVATVAQLGVEPANIGRAVSVMQVLRSLGGAVGTAITGALVAATLTDGAPGRPVPGPDGAPLSWTGPFDVLAVLGVLTVIVALPLRACMVSRLAPRHRVDEQHTSRGRHRM
jgi:MFS family permease